MRNVLIIFFLSLLIGCQPEPIPIKLPDYEPKVVVNSRIVPNSIMLVGLTRSFTVLSEAGFNDQIDSATITSLLVDSALVTVSHEGFVDTLFKVTSGLYASISTVQTIGVDYVLNVYDYDSKDRLYAVETMLDRISLDTVYPIVTKTLEDTSIVFHVEFSDPSSKKNYYLVNVYSRNSLESNFDFSSVFESGNNTLHSTLIIKDSEIKNNKAVLDIEVSSIGLTDSVAVSMSNISETYYNYLNARLRAGNIFTEITNEPINYPTNVIGGYGFFNTHFPSVRYFDMNEF